MARFSGKKWRGFGREDRAEKQHEAEQRNLRTKPGRRASHRRSHHVERNCE